MLRQIADGLLAFGPLGVLLICFLDSAGVPLPTVLDAWLVIIATQRPQSAYFSAAMGVFGSMAGNYALFRAARYGGTRFFKTETTSNKSEKFRLWFSRYGLITVFVPAVVPFIPLPLKVFVISAGAMRTPTARFLSVIFVARVIRYFGETYVGIRLGQDAVGFLTRNAWNIAGVVLVIVLIFVAMVKWYDRRAETS
ncbi:MAG: VTT domain-containing protein [Acidobacteriales bacterium]|nr:VTT domain-containing protein [Terriglobales bacterium]